VRLRYGYWIRCEHVEMDADGTVVRVHCTHDPATRGGGNPPDGRKAQGTLHWVSAEHGLPAEFRLYGQLFTDERPGTTDDWMDGLNSESLVTKYGVVEPSVADDPTDRRYQFERTGYFWRDPTDGAADALVFNRIVALKDGFIKKVQAPRTEPRSSRDKNRPPQAARVIEADVQAAANALTARGVNPGDALALATDAESLAFFEGVVAQAAAADAGRWVVNELPRVRQGRPLVALPFGAAELAALISLIDGGTLSNRLAKQVLEVMAADGGQPAAIAKANGWQQMDDAHALAAVVDQVVTDNADQAARVADNPRLLGFFVGQVMKATGGKAPGKMVNSLLRARLGLD
jgi:glutaminyl-tRNA synthetase